MTALPATLYSREPMALHRHGLHVPTCKRVPSLHVVSPSENLSPQHPEYGVESEVVSRASFPRIDRERAPIQDMDRIEVSKRIAGALAADYGHLKSTHKEIADDAGVSPKTVEAWMQGISLPGFVPTIRLMAESPAFAKEALRLAAREADLDPEFQREFLSLMQKFGGR